MEQPRDTARVRDTALGVLAVLLSGIAFLLPTLRVGLDSASIASALLAVAVAALVGTAHATAVLSRTHGRLGLVRGAPRTTAGAGHPRDRPHAPPAAPPGTRIR